MLETYPDFTMHYARMDLHVEILEMDDLKNHLDSARKVETMEEVDHQDYRVTQSQGAQA
jgi:hypothetical protein